MTWTQGQPPRVNQSPFIDPTKEMKPNDRRNNRNPRAPQGTSRHSQNMDNVAATFTQEGLQTFSTIFSTSVEAAIAKSLPEIVERAVERQIKQVLQQTIENFEKQTADLASQIRDLKHLATRLSEGAEGASIVSKAPESVAVDDQQPQCRAENDEETKAPAVPAGDTVVDEPYEELTMPISDRPSDHPSPLKASVAPTQTRIAKEVELVVKTLKEIGRPVKSDELRALASEVHWGANPSVKMNNLINKSNGQIERVGRGRYQYKNQVD
ncbi:hypothetical protein AAC03nite_05680 [Alicyclobacillus acidoterrestris]|uniref:hypothetical protein n=1 Tax=Alicyclobacillus suci TaxID=2816080 RepID=UPI0011912030|nr:hypothetical protein [Alicyclobacillus suci]GEO24783.1 hypothetical protein AAC03nite_05680 [Alicyclobacillus acidoterrestris]